MRPLACLLMAAACGGDPRQHRRQRLGYVAPQPFTPRHHLDARLREAEREIERFRAEALRAELGDDLLVVTQNVDDLHERAGSTRVLHMHGELRRVRCTHCGARLSWDGDLLGATECPSCGQPALRPDIVWFGEYPYGLEEIDRAVSACEMFVAIGTSGTVTTLQSPMSSA